MHIAYLVQQFPPEVGAGPARVTELGLHWLAAGEKVTVITGMPARVVPGRSFGGRDPAYRGRWFVEEDWRGIRVLRSWLYTPSKGGFVRTIANNTSFMMTAALHGLARVGKPDVLIASSPPFFPHISGRAVSALRRIPLVLEVRDLWPDYLVGMGVLKPNATSTRALFALESHLLRKADRVVVVTESFRSHLERKGVDRARITVIPNGVDLTQYYPAIESPPIPALRKSDELVVGYLGNFGASQDIPSIIRAARILADERARVRFVLVGDGTEKHRAEAELERLTPTNISLHPPLPKEETRAFYNYCDVCLVPLAGIPVLQDTVPSKLFEVMACARPVLGSLSGEAETVVKASGTGITVKPGDAAAIAAGVRAFAAMSADQRANMGTRGPVYVKHHYNRAALADRYLQLLREIRDEQRHAKSDRALLPTNR